MARVKFEVEPIMISLNRAFGRGPGMPAALALAKPDVMVLPAGRLAPGVEVDGDIAAGLEPAEARLAALEQPLRAAVLRVLAGDLT